MIICATKVRFLEDVVVEMTFQDGKIVRYDMARMFDKYPQLQELKTNRALFEQGRLDPGGYGVIWNDELDFSAMSVYECGEVVGQEAISINQQIGVLLLTTREALGITQTELARKSRIDQGDISKIERGLGNPTLSKISKLFHALGKEIALSIVS